MNLIYALMLSGQVVEISNDKEDLKSKMIDGDYTLWRLVLI